MESKLLAVRLTLTEYNMIKKNAGDVPISRYIKRIVFNKLNSEKV